MGRRVKHFHKPYKVIFDPLDSFTANSSFSRNEIDDMLSMGYLARGTRFRKNGSVYEVNEFYRLERITWLTQ